MVVKDRVRACLGKAGTFLSSAFSQVPKKHWGQVGRARNSFVRDGLWLWTSALESRALRGMRDRKAVRDYDSFCRDFAGTQLIPSNLHSVLRDLGLERRTEPDGQRILRTLQRVPRSLTKRYEPVFTRMAVVKGSLGLATYQHVRPPSWPHLLRFRRGLRSVSPP